MCGTLYFVLVTFVYLHDINLLSYSSNAVAKPLLLYREVYLFARFLGLALSSPVLALLKPSLTPSRTGGLFPRLKTPNTTAAPMIGSRGSALVFLRSCILAILLSCFLLSCNLSLLLPALPRAFPSRQSKPAPQSGRCLLRSCCFDCAQTVNSYYTILVGFRYLPELFHIRPNKLRSAFA